ncbi:MAG: GNAT family N-acetyltransferase [Oenococcus sp.]|uniref:GNAT family N-acetyltransferase n=1 Tax=Oenococcus TaxID=46254 RepID=UPI0021E80691|nr:GNAT family N-acetyltransferase [Oenococcus kitaharae]MCV3295628.1 GNAT family N-acetyltransferase [Oenococcus kitaharae]
MLEIRFLNENDFDQYRQIRLAALLSDPTAFGSTYEEENRYPDRHFKDRLQNSNGRFIVGAFIGSDLICIAALRRLSNQKEQHKAELVSVYCLPEYRHRGMARKTIQFCIDQARQIEGLRQILLAVSANNQQAISLYKSLNFAKYGTEPDSLFDGKEYFDENLMILMLKND